MAKGLSLVNTNIINFSLSVQGDDAITHIEYEVIDDTDSVIKREVLTRNFTQWANQVRASLNNALGLMSQEVNQECVNEDKPTWTDI